MAERALKVGRDMTTEQQRVLRAVRKTRERPSIESDDWDLFMALVDAGLVEDRGLGNARITPAGRYALSPKGDKP